MKILLIFRFFHYTVKALNNGHLRVIKSLSVIKRCPLLGGSLTKIVTFGTKHFVRYSRHVRYRDVRYWELSLYWFIDSENLCFILTLKEKRTKMTFNSVHFPNSEKSASI